MANGIQIHSDGGKDLVLATGRAHPELAAEVAQFLDIGLLPVEARDFANSETYVRFGESVRGTDLFILQSHTSPVNQWLMEQLIMIDAAKRASAKRITAVVPFMAYARQDKKSRGREPISARLVCDLLCRAGADRIMSIDLHTPQIQGFFDGPVDHLFAQPVLIDYVRTRMPAGNITVVSPDAGRIRVAEQWALELGGGPLAFVHKTRDVTRANVSHANRVVGDVDGRDCVLVDDLIDTAGTITEAIKVVLEAGAKSVIVAATHGVLSPPAAERLASSGACEVVVTNTLPLSEDQKFPGLTQLSIAEHLARAIKAVFEDQSVTAVFDGQMI
ncbi:MAG: ribose-phosphate diphosphokinase [Cellulomonadaceae bacterium]|jgi:ribose-phosphate pyrophosphokinase|nr:ribose-phosphate diphosphokinase [Cellulomonadaceae bacterium]